MNNALRIVVVMVAAAVSAYADTPHSESTVQRSHHHQRKPTGGLLLREAPKTIITIRDKQSAFTANQIALTAESISRALNMPVYRIEADDQRSGSRIEVVIVDELQGMGPAKTVLVAPEQGWATLATKWLIADGANNEARNRRLYLELMRTIGMAAGVGISMYQPCIMTLVKNVRDLDAIKLDMPGPEGINNIETGMRSFGIDRLKMTTYRMACREGWAPQPTNDVQKAIWNEVHTIPDKPIKITYDKDKQRPVVK